MKFTFNENYFWKVQNVFKYRFFPPILNIFIYTLLLAIFLLTERFHFLYYLTWLRQAFFSPPYQILAQQGNYFKKKHGCDNDVLNKSNVSECCTASTNNYRTCWKSCVSGTFKEDFNSGKYSVIPYQDPLDKSA